MRLVQKHYFSLDTISAVVVTVLWEEENITAVQVVKLLMVVLLRRM